MNRFPCKSSGKSETRLMFACKYEIINHNTEYTVWLKSLKMIISSVKTDLENITISNHKTIFF